MAEILNESFLREVFKQITFASKEFEMPNAFTLVEKDTSVDSFIETNPYTGEPLDPNFSDPILQNNTPKETVFSAELEKISETDYQEGIYGQMPIGTQIVLINSEELDIKDFNENRFQNAIGIKIKVPENVNAFGTAETIKEGIYKIKAVQPNYLKDKLIELAVFIELIEEE